MGLIQLAHLPQATSCYHVFIADVTTERSQVDPGLSWSCVLLELLQLELCLCVNQDECWVAIGQR
jgi:hypothetical protein